MVGFKILSYPVIQVKGALSVAVSTVAVLLSVREVLEVRVVASLLGGDSASGVIDEQHLQKLKTHVVEVRAQHSVLISLPLGERWLEVGVGCDSGPHLF